jgi:hypothetical protein
MSVERRGREPRKTSPSGTASGIAIRVLFLLFLVGGLDSWTGCAGISQSNSTPPAGSQISIAISPSSATLVSDGALQFSAIVGGTVQTGVTWSTSAGTISATGLLTAPTVSSATNLTVTATSAAVHGDTASASVDVTAPPSNNPTIDTSSLAPAMVGTLYSESLIASGGQTPYQWSIVGGALPHGIQLGSLSGTLMGTATATGESSFTVELMDTRGKTARQDLNLIVSPASSCGPPSYACSRSDTDVIAPAVPPQLGTDPNYFGGHSGAGMVGIDPPYNNRILRVTDGNTTEAGMSFETPSSAETNVISYDETLFFVVDEGNVPCLFQFNQAAFNAQFKGCYYKIGEGDLQFGYTAADNRAFFNYWGPHLHRFVIDPTTWVISSDTTFNQGLGYFDPDGPLCLNGQLAAGGVWYVHDTALSSDDSTFIASLGIEQDEDAYIVVWNAAKGCRWMNVKTWEVSQGWNTGLTDPVKIEWASGATPTGPGGVHNVNLDRSGAYGVLTINGTSLPNKVFWTLDTNLVDNTCVDCVSHWACDYGVCFWDYQYQTTYDMRSLVIAPRDEQQAIPDMDTTPALGQWDDDQHVSHANASPGVKNIYLVAWQPNSGGAKVTGVWSDEITGVSWDGSKRTIRFNKNWASGYGGFGGSARCPISRQGHYAICSSDYEMYNLDKGFGNGLNQDTCDHTLLSEMRGTNGCRTDVLLFELR